MNDGEEEWNALTAEREKVVATILSKEIAVAWREIKECFLASEPLHSGTPTIWEGPGRAWLLPLQFELLRGFINSHGEDANKYIVDDINHPECLVAGYCILGLSLAGLTDKLVGFPERNEKILTILGSFAWEGTLTEYANKTLREE